MNKIYVLTSNGSVVKEIVSWKLFVTKNKDKIKSISLYIDYDKNETTARVVSKGSVIIILEVVVDGISPFLSKDIKDIVGDLEIQETFSIVGGLSTKTYEKH